jgi:hypothetical protein
MMDAGQRGRVIAFLHLVAEGSKNQRRALLSTIAGAQLKILRDVSYNILLNSNIQLTQEQRSYLRRHSSIIKQWASRHVSACKKRDLASSHPYLVKKLAEIALTYLE